MLASNVKKIKAIPTYQLHISLIGCSPPIWRRVIVPGDVHLDVLHEVLQTAMGWAMSHSHEYVVGEAHYIPPEMSEEYDGEPGYFNAASFTLAEIAPKEKSHFVYIYDFGDDWRHKVVVERILDPRFPRLKQACVIAGQNVCPPEDCGGISGYADLVRTLKSPKSKRYDELLEWVGGGWDPTYFEAAETTALLATVQL